MKLKTKTKSLNGDFYGKVKQKEEEETRGVAVVGRGGN